VSGGSAERALKHVAGLIGPDDDPSGRLVLDAGRLLGEPLGIDTAITSGSVGRAGR
jgi:hypothetical protein